MSSSPTIVGIMTTAPESFPTVLSTTLTAALYEILDATILLMEGDLGNIQLYDPAAKTLEIVAQRGFPEGFRDVLGRMTIEDETAGARSLRTRSRVVIRDINADPGYAPYRKAAALAGFRAVQATPLLGRDGEFLGALLTHLREPRDFSTRELRVLDLYSRQAADAIVRARVEHDLSTARRRLDAALIAGEVGVFEWDIPSERVYGDPNYMRLFGLSSKLGFAPPATFAERIHPDDQPERAARVQQTLETGAPYECEYRIVNGSSTRWVIARGKVERDASGKPVRFPGVVLDITTRRQAEQDRQNMADNFARLSRVHETILSTTDDFATVVDRNGRFLYANRRLLEVWGKSLDQVIGKTRLELGYERWHHELHMREIAQILQTKKQIRGEVPYTGPTGISGIFDYIFTPVLGPDGEVESIVGSSRNVTERKRTEETLREIDRQKNAFLAQLAHELRNPLAPIRNAVRVFRKTHDTDPDANWAAGVIDRQVDHLTRLIDDLLDVSRIGRNKLDLRLSRIELQEIVRGAIEICRPLIDQNRHDVMLRMAPEPIYLQGDLARLTQVMMNILTNAAKYMDPGGYIEICARREGTQAVLRVKDKGIGMDAVTLAHAFDMFYQADSSLERSQSGLGIGLSLVRSVVDLHEGTVEGHSAGPGQGSEFIVRLPAETVGVKSEDPPPVAADSGNNGAPRRVLVVDDNRDAAESLALFLKMSGHVVQIAYDGMEALAVAEAFQPEIVLLDIGMPKLNGYEVCQRIRGRAWGKNILIVAQTGWGQEEDKLRTRDAGFDEHLVKPVDPMMLINLIAACKGRHDRDDATA
jgi:PAS domain S-box-containing protein